MLIDSSDEEEVDKTKEVEKLLADLKDRNLNIDDLNKENDAKENDFQNSTNGDYENIQELLFKKINDLKSQGANIDFKYHNPNRNH